MESESEIHVLQMKAEEKEFIKTWPKYPKEFSELDYALRDGGWIDSKEDADLLSVYLEKMLIGFTGLFGINNKHYEILIAINADYLGKGYGTTAMKLALKHYFMKYNMDKITLCVRKSNKIAKHVYEKIGFSDDGESKKVIQGTEIDFWDMYINRDTISF